jgi:hypothetical protein
MVHNPFLNRNPLSNFAPIIFLHSITQTFPNMSKKLFFIPALLLGLMVLVSTSCNTDKCKSKDCGNGICSGTDGVCNCDPGYEYDVNGSCKVKAQDKFVGSYTIHDGCDSGPNDYLGSISANADLTKIDLSNVWQQFQHAVTASIDGSTITIARQEPDGAADGYFIQGSGTSATVNGKLVLTLSIKVTKEAVPGTVTATDNCTTTWTHQ